jgi:hypothetical protein
MTRLTYVPKYIAGKSTSAPYFSVLSAELRNFMKVRAQRPSSTVARDGKWHAVIPARLSFPESVTGGAVSFGCAGACHSIGSKEYCSKQLPLAFGIYSRVKNDFDISLDSHVGQSIDDAAVKRSREHHASLSPGLKDFQKNGWHLEKLNISSKAKANNRNNYDRPIQRIKPYLEHILQCCYSTNLAGTVSN